MTEGITWQRKVLGAVRQEYAVPFQLAALLVILLLAELIFSWPYGHIAQVRTFTAMLPIRVWQTLTTLGDARWPLAVALILTLRDRQILLVYLVALLMGWLTVRGMKQWFHIPRPGLLLPILDASLSGHEASARNSFPSSHAMVIFSFATVWALHFPRRQMLFVIALAFLVSLSRIAIGAHWPIDVLGGGVIGVTAATLAVYVLRRLQYSPGERAILLLTIVVALVVSSMPWLDSGSPNTWWLRLLGAFLGVLAAGIAILRSWRLRSASASRTEMRH